MSSTLSDVPPQGRRGHANRPGPRMRGPAGGQIAAAMKMPAGALAAMLAAALGLPACGGNSQSSKPTDQQWLARANAECATLNTQTKALGPHPRPGPGQTVAQVVQRSAAYLDQLIPIQVSAVARIRALGPRPQNGELVTQSLTAVDALNADLKQAQAAAHAAKTQAFLAAISRVNGTDGNRATETAKRAGLDVCAAAG